MSGDPIRILMYSHDTYGLGHITRTLRIARALRQAFEHASVLILTGSPVAPYMPLPDGADFVKMPSVVKAGPDRYRSRDLAISFRRIKRMRRDLIRGTCETFRPHLLLVDNVPLGMKSEILPALRYLRKESPATRIVLNLRDILDDPEVIDAAWERDGVRPALDEFYDRIIVLGDSAFFDARQAYRLPAEKTVHVGYAAPGEAHATLDGADGPIARWIRPRRAHVTRRILVTAGGGGDGVEFLKAVLAGLERLVSPGTRLPGSAIRLEVVTGPLMDPEERSSIMRIAASHGADTREFVPDIPRRMARADLVISMAGYNTCCEILTHARASLLFPRLTPRVEQLLRANILSEHGLVRTLAPHERDPDAIAEEVLRALADGPTVRPERLPAMDGLARHAREIHDLLFQDLPRGERRGRVPLAGVKEARLKLGGGATGGRLDARDSGDVQGLRRGVGGVRATEVNHGTYWYWPGAGALPSRPAPHRPPAGEGR